MSPSRRLSRSPSRRHPYRAVAGLLAIGVVLAACGGSGSQPQGSSSSAASKLVTTTPVAVGDVDSVTWALPNGEPLSLDPARTGGYSENTVTTNLCENLLRLEPDFSTSPGLARAVTQKDPTTLVIDLRDGVRFWDGNPMTADDVVFSLSRHLDPKLGSYYAGGYGRVKSITATGPLQVTVAFSVPDVQFVQNLASMSGAIVEKAFAQRAGATFGARGTGVMCTGPFSLGSWESGRQLVLKRNASYWNPARKARAATFTFKFFADDSALTSALRAGEVDGTYQPPVGSLAALGASGVGTVYLGPSTESLSMGPVASEGPAADPRIRTALDLAIDKRAVIATVLKGYGQPLKTFTPPLVWAGSPASAVYDAGYAALPDTSAADLAQARKLVQEAAPSRTTLTVVVPVGNQALLQTATLAQAAAAQIGLTLTIKQLQPSEFAGLFYDPTLRSGIDLLVTTGYVEAPGALYYAPDFVLPGGLFNWTKWQDPAVTADIAAATSSTDPRASAQKFVAAQAVFAQARLQITFGEAYNRLFLNKRLTGAPASFSYISSPWAALVGKASA